MDRDGRQGPAWKAEAEIDFMPKVEMIEWVLREPVPSTKNKSDILTLVGKLVAHVHAEGFEVVRLHSDRGREYREYHNATLRAWCAKHKIHKTWQQPGSQAQPSGLEAQLSGSKVQSSGLKVQPAGSQVQPSGSEPQSVGLPMQGATTSDTSCDGNRDELDQESKWRKKIPHPRCKCFHCH